MRILSVYIRHADLLHLIAQKQRKCLELRDQLAAHENELEEREHISRRPFFL